MSSSKIIKERLFEGHLEPITYLTFSLDNQYVISSSFDNSIKIWDIITGKEINSLKHTSYITHIVCSPNNKYIISITRDRNINIWDFKSGNLIKSISTNNEIISSICVSPNKNILLTGSREHTVRMWDLDNQKEIKQFKSPKSVINVVRFSNNGELVFIGSKTIHISNSESGEIICKTKGHKQAIAGVKFSIDDKHLYWGDRHSSVHKFDIENGNEICLYQSPPNSSGGVYGSDFIDFTSDLKYALTGHHFGYTTYWEIESGQEIYSTMGRRFDCNVEISQNDKYGITSDGNNIKLLYL